MSKKVAIVTGANTGVGKETAVGLAKEGYHVIEACRSATKGQEAVEEIRKKTLNENVEFMELDLASLASVRKFAENFLNLKMPLHLLINNAGIMAEGVSTDGFEIMFAVNHLGHHYLTNLLLPLLKKNAPSRIVVVSSDAHGERWTENPVIIQELPHKKYSGYYSVTKGYANSKLCNILYTQELNRLLQGTQVTVNSVHPGHIKTEILRDAPWYFNWIIVPIRSLFFDSAAKGGSNVLYVATGSDCENKSGEYYYEAKLSTAHHKMITDANAAELWKLSEELVSSSTAK